MAEAAQSSRAFPRDFPIARLLGFRIVSQSNGQAVAEFQADNPPLAVDGICGPQTRAKLIELYGC